MSNGVFERSEAVLEPQVRAESPGRNRRAIGAGLVAALLVVGLYGIAIWAIVVLAQAIV